jgi:hypothetical protein
VRDAIWIAVTIVLGVTQAVQVVLLAGMNRARGPAEASYVSILGTLAGFSLVLFLRTLFGPRLALPPPFEHPAITGAVAVATGALLVLAMRGLPAIYAVTGLFPIPFLLAASYFTPRIGVGLFVAALITGQLGGGVLLDHLGAFGTATRPIDAIRILGIVACVVGVVLVRGFR